MSRRNNFFERLAQTATVFSGTNKSFLIALLIVVGWLVTGPFFNFSDTWQLVINTSTTIITFLMVFLIQRMQNKDSRAIHLKLNELVAALKEPSNRLIDVEDLNEEELEILSNYYKTLSEMARKEKYLSVSHSVEEAVELHKHKYPHPDQTKK
jgi:low affinity Fe/Cu permease